MTSPGKLTLSERRVRGRKPKGKTLTKDYTNGNLSMRRAIFRKLVKLFTKPNEYLIDGLSISEQFKVSMGAQTQAVLDLKQSLRTYSEQIK